MESDCCFDEDDADVWSDADRVMKDVLGTKLDREEIGRVPNAFAVVITRAMAAAEYFMMM